MITSTIITITLSPALKQFTHNVANIIVTSMSINVSQEFLAWLKQPKLLQSPRQRSTDIQTVMSGNDW